mmetsp:Transcript_70452/g.193326  ORF Transcript_70452/g.193326 Transcript_70452/m.193326 type:complete len:203 (-) Transcript_70452:177-785(-)
MHRLVTHQHTSPWHRSRSPRSSSSGSSSSASWTTRHRWFRQRGRYWCPRTRGSRPCAAMAWTRLQYCLTRRLRGLPKEGLGGQRPNGRSSTRICCVLFVHLRFPHRMRLDTLTRAWRAGPIRDGEYVALLWCLRFALEPTNALPRARRTGPLCSVHAEQRPHTVSSIPLVLRCRHGRLRKPRDEPRVENCSGWWVERGAWQG